MRDERLPTQPPPDWGVHGRRVGFAAVTRYAEAVQAHADRLLAQGSPPGIAYLAALRIELERLRAALE